MVRVFIVVRGKVVVDVSSVWVAIVIQWLVGSHVFILG